MRVLLFAIAALFLIVNATAQDFTMYATISGAANNAIVGDVDNDGQNELVIAQGFNVSIWEHNPDGTYSLSWKKENLCSKVGVKALFIADTDNDGDNELVVGASGASDPKGYIYIFDFRNGRYQEVWKYYVGEYLRHSSIYVGDADNDGENEIVVGVSWYGRYAMLIEHTYGDNYRVDWKTFYYYNVMCPYIGDADNDGYNELILASSTWDDSKIAIGDYNK